MPRATIASRQLKNKDTGLDLLVPSYREIKGIVMSTVYYQVVLVSKMACFKTPTHRDSDVVQYSIEKKLNEFEELFKKISAQFPHTAIPQINKKSILVNVNDAVLRQRRNSLNGLLKFLASVSDMATCAPLLEFLGVDSVRAKKFSHGEHSEETLAPETEPIDQEETANVIEFVDEEDDEEGDEELFAVAGKQDYDEEDMFGSDQVQMFERQDLKAEITEEDEKDFGFIPDGFIAKTKTASATDGDDGENSDLFQIDGDLDQLMLVDFKKKERSTAAMPPIAPVSQRLEPNPTLPKPTIASKPKPGLNPSLPEKPKVDNGNEETKDEKSGHKPIATARTKPVPSQRPKPALRNRASKPSASEELELFKPTDKKSEDGASGVDNLDQDDIMKYLQANIASNDEEVDLFS